MLIEPERFSASCLSPSMLLRNLRRFRDAMCRWVKQFAALERLLKVRTMRSEGYFLNVGTIDEVVEKYTSARGG